MKNWRMKGVNLVFLSYCLVAWTWLQLLCGGVYAVSSSTTASTSTSPSSVAAAVTGAGKTTDEDITAAIQTSEATPKTCLRIASMTWNLGEKLPTEEDCAFLADFCPHSSGTGSGSCGSGAGSGDTTVSTETTGADIIALGIQECEDIRPRRQEGHRSRHWKRIQALHFEEAGYECISCEKLGGMQLSVYANAKARDLITDLQVISVPCGVGNVLSNKGGICMLLQLQHKQTIALINAHLAAHNHQVSEYIDIHHLERLCYTNSPYLWFTTDEAAQC